MNADAPRAVRAGEELDVARLASFMGAPSVAVEQFPKGHSNLTYLVRSGDREYVLRRPPFGSKVKSAHDMGREVTVLSKLAPVYARAPKVFAYDASGEVLMCRHRSVAVIARDPEVHRRPATVALRVLPNPGSRTIDDAQRVIDERRRLPGRMRCLVDSDERRKREIRLARPDVIDHEISRFRIDIQPASDIAAEVRSRHAPRRLEFQPTDAIALAESAGHWRQ